MDFSGGLQIRDGAWIPMNPVTPAKPVPMRPQPNAQGNHVGRYSLLEGIGCPAGYMQGNPPVANRTAMLLNSINQQQEFNSWETALTGKKRDAAQISDSYQQAMNNVAAGWNNIPCSNLLALADAASRTPSSTRQRASNFAAARRIFPFAYTPESSQQQSNGLPLGHIQAESSWQQSNCLPYGHTQAESRRQQSNGVPFVHNQDENRQQRSKVVPFTPSQAENFQQQWNVFPFAQTQVESNRQRSKNLALAHNQAGSSSSSRQQSNVLPLTHSQVENCRQQSNVVPVAHTQAESSQQQSNTLNMLPQSQHAVGTNQRSNNNCQAQIPQYGFPVPYRTMYGLNDQPRTMAGAVSNGSINFQFEPITPDKARNEQARYEQTSQPSGMLNKFFDDRLPVERQMLQNSVNLAGGKTVELHCQESQLQSEVNSFPTAPEALPAGDSTYSPLSAPLEANHNSNKGQVEIDLNTPPQQKPKRKKIRPRVVKEGKPKRTPKSTEKQASPKENQPAKRKYVRRNGSKASNTSPNAVEEIPNPNTGSTVNSCKRSLNFNTGSQEESRSSNCNLKMDVPSNLDSRSGRVAFDSISEAEELNSRSKDSTGNQSTLQLAGGLEVVVENTSAGFAFDLNHSLTQMLEEYITLPEQPTPSTPPPLKSGPSSEKLKALHTERYEAEIVGDSSYSRSRIQEAFSSSLFPGKSVETNDSAISSMSNPSFHSASMILHNSTCSQNLRLAEGEHQSVSKRGYSHNPEEAFLQSLNLVGSHVDSSKAYHEILHRHEHHRQVSNFGLQYPDTCKKRRVEKSQKTVTKSALMVLGDGSKVDTNIGAFIPQGHDRGLGTQLFHVNGTESLQNGGNNSVHEDYHQSLGMKKVHYMQSSPVELHLHNKMPSGAKHAEVQTSDFMLTCQTERMAMKRSKGATQVQDFASLTAISQCNNTPSAEPSRNSSSGGKQGLGLCHSSESFLGTLAHDKSARMELYKDGYTTPAIGNRKSYSNRNEVRIQETQSVVYSYDHSLAKSKGPVEVIVSSPVDEIIQKLSSLNINDMSSTLLAHEQQALVPYTANGQMVLFDPTKKRKPRAKVDLDPETDRVWKLLMGKERDNSDDKTDADKEKWWEQERQTFHGRAMSFIARMHLIQGDRRFLKWNGSVVDSVVGVFLTQNVSDHLSSSAFMALAAHFPLKSRSDDKTCDGAYMYVEEPEACIIDSNETTREPISKENCTTFHKGQQVDYRQTDNSNEILGSNARDGNGVDITNCKEPFISECTPDMCPVSNDNIPEMHRSSIVCASLIIEDRKLIEVHSPVVSSQGSVDSSTNISAGTTSIESPRLLEGEERGALEELASSQNSHADEIVRSCSESNSDDDHGFSTTSFMDLLRMQDRALLQEYISQENGSLSLDIHSEICCEQPKAMEFNKRESNSDIPIISGNYSICVAPSSAVFDVECPEVPSSAEVTEIKELDSTSLHDKSDRTKLQGTPPSFPDALDDARTKRRNNVEQQARSDLLNPSVETLEVVESTIPINSQNPIENKVAEKERFYASGRVPTDPNIKAGNSGTKPEKEKRKEHDWDSLRKEVYHRCGRRERSHETMDSLDWEAVRCADVNEIAKTIKERGMNNMLAERIKAFLNRLIRDHESIDLEWLRDVPPDKAKEYLLSVRGLGLKSVECIRLLTLHNLAFPVDTNVGRIAVRLGWVPLQPLPESLQLHLLELYPIQESIQKYLWPRLCTLDQKTLYELHYQLITFGKVFCTKSKPNCNACPMRAECRHFASAFASARLALPGPEEKGIVSSAIPITSDQSYHGSTVHVNPMSLPAPETKTVSETRSKISDREPIIEVPASPEPVTEINDIEDFEDYDDYEEDPDEIPTIELNIKEFRTNLENYIQENNMELQEVAMSNALVALTPQAASIPTPKLKNVSRLRTEHQVYELPDTHALLNGVAKRVPGEVCYYLLAIWAPGETAESTQPPERCCSSEVGDSLCNKKTCFSCNSAREATSQTVRGTLLIPCKTAMRGSFPLNGTYFQVNEVFADHESSVNPIDVPRDLLWDLPRRTVYFGTSIPSIFKGQTTEEIQSCFWRGYVCLRGFDQKSRAPKPLQPRLHFPASRQLQLQKLKQEQEQLKSKNS